MQFLEILQKAVPRLRIVVAGRVPLSVDGFPTDPRPLGDFDDAAAQLFLEKRGVQSPELIRTIIKRIGKSPLSLLLAATAVQQAQKSGEAENLKLTGTRGARLSESQIQGYLYRRILNHIQDEEVRRLAYPGLVLRRVTPDIIQNVLAEPCKVPVPDESAAQDLFDRLAREVTLVQFEEGALVHRRDLRRIMLPLLRDSAESETARQIEDAAIRYYEEWTEASSARRRSTIASRVTSPSASSPSAGPRMSGHYCSAPSTRTSSVPASGHGCFRAWIPISGSTTRRAQRQISRPGSGTPSRRSASCSSGTGRLPLCPSIQARSERSPGSPLYKAEADILQRMKRWDEARDVLETGAESAGEKGDTVLVIDLLMQAAQLDLGLTDFTAAERKLDDAAELLQDRGDRPRTLRLALIRFELGLRLASPGRPSTRTGPPSLRCHERPPAARGTWPGRLDRGGARYVRGQGRPPRHRAAGPADATGAVACPRSRHCRVGRCGLAIGQPLEREPRR